MSVAELHTTRISRTDDADVLFRRWHNDRDSAARDALVERFLPLARSLARRYQRSPDHADDLLQVASLALIKAIDRFDVDRGHSFATFAAPTILGELKRHFRDTRWAVRVPRGLQELAAMVEDATRELTPASGRAPTAPQLAQYLEIDIEQVLDGLQVGHAHDALSLDAPRPNADEPGASLGDSLGFEDGRLALVEDGATIATALKTLPERDRRILYLRFAEDLTQTEIAQRVGVSQMQVSRLLRRTLAELRELTA